MKPCLFDSFADMIGALSPANVLRTLERERRLLEADLARQSFSSLWEVSSILSFCWFIEAIRQHWPTFAVPAPSQSHLAFYRTTIQRLIAAGELPPETAMRFDQTFYSQTASPTTTAVGDPLNLLKSMAHQAEPLNGVTVEQHL